MDITENQAAGLSTEADTRALAALAVADQFDADAARAVVAGGASVIATLNAYEASMIPAKDADAATRNAAARALHDALRPIGSKVAPHLSTGQAKAWCVAMVGALSDLSPRTAAKAAREALHVPMQFLSEAETAIRAKASEIDRRHWRALQRLRWLQAEIEAAAQPKLAAPVGWEGGQTARLTAEELRRTPKHVLQFGLSAGFLTKADLEAAGVSEHDENIEVAA